MLKVDKVVIFKCFFVSYRCLEVAGIALDPSSFKELPVPLKELLLFKLSKMGLCSGVGLENLVHPSLLNLGINIYRFIYRSFVVF